MKVNDLKQNKWNKLGVKIGNNLKKRNCNKVYINQVLIDLQASLKNRSIFTYVLLDMFKKNNFTKELQHIIVDIYDDDNYNYEFIALNFLKGFKRSVL